MFEKACSRQEALENHIASWKGVRDMNDLKIMQAKDVERLKQEQAADIHILRTDLAIQENDYRVKHEEAVQELNLKYLNQRLVVQHY